MQVVHCTLCKSENTQRINTKVSYAQNSCCHAYHCADCKVDFIYPVPDSDLESYSDGQFKSEIKQNPDELPCPKMSCRQTKSFDKLLYIREELNGVSVYDQEKGYVSFFEGLMFSQVEAMDNADEARRFFRKNSDRLSANLDFQAPLKVNWLISDKCNLDCAYCFANDKFDLNEERTDIDDVLSSIRAVNPLILGLTGGEPTLSPSLYQIIEKTSDHYVIILDTNGAHEFTKEQLKLIKESHVHVRISLDTLDPQIARELRPHKNGSQEYLKLILKNIKNLADGNLSIHTVVTQKNIHDLFKLGRKLIELGVSRWHLYGVSNSKKCQSVFDELKVSENELYFEYNKLRDAFSDKLRISCYYDEKNVANDMILMVDSSGRFFVDSTEKGISYIGKDSHHPTLEEIKASMNTEAHRKAYLSLALQDK